MQTTLPTLAEEESPQPQRARPKHPLKVIKDLGDTLTAEERSKLHQRLAYLYRIHSTEKNWKAVGTIRGLCSQFAILESMVAAKGYRLPPKPRRLRRKVHPNQLALIGALDGKKQKNAP